MKKTSLLLVFGLALVLASAAVPKANAGVVFGVGVGAPVYVHPVHAYRYFAPGYGYVAPGYFAPEPYVTFGPAPFYWHAYVAPPVFYGRYYGRRFDGRHDFYRYRR